MKKIVTVEPLDDEEHLELKARALGCLNVATHQGPVHCHDAPGVMTLEVTREDGSESVAILLYRGPESEDSFGVGLIVQLDPETTRVLAASLLRLANRLDGGKGAH